MNYLCEICGVLFQTGKVLTSHQRTHRKQECKNCNKEFLINSQWAQKICLGLSEIYRCKVCPYETNLKRNLNSHHQVHKSVHHYSYCMYSSTKVGNLKRHLLQKHNIIINDVKVSNSVGFGIFENRMEWTMMRIVQNNVICLLILQVRLII